MSVVRVTGPDTAVARELERLAHDDGSLVASEIVEAARDEDSPLHSRFTWDDELAANERRLGQARQLIASYKLKIITQKATGETRQLLVRGYRAASQVSRPVASPGTYVPVASLSPLEQNILLQRMYREIKHMREQYSHLPQFWDYLAQALAEHEEIEGAAASGA